MKTTNKVGPIEEAQTDHEIACAAILEAALPLADLISASVQADILRADGDRFIADAHAKLDAQLASARALHAAGIEAVRARVGASDREVEARRFDEERARIAWRDADAALADSIDASAAIKTRDEAEVAHRRAIKTRELAEVFAANERVDLTTAALEKGPLDPRGNPVSRALVLAAQARARLRETIALESAALSFSGHEIVMAAISAGDFLEHRADARANPLAFGHDAAHNRVRGLADFINSSGPFNLSEPHLVECLEAFAEGRYHAHSRAEIDAMNARGLAASAVQAKYEAEREVTKKRGVLDSKASDIRALLAIRNPFLTHGPQIDRPQLEAELASVEAEISKLGTPPAAVADRNPGRWSFNTANDRRTA